MNDNHGNKWRHATQITPLPDKDAAYIAVFDDEGPGLVVLYKTDAAGKRFSPCRSVSTKDRKHFTSVLEGWASDRPLLDKRLDRTLPLPRAVGATSKA